MARKATDTPKITASVTFLGGFSLAIGDKVITDDLNRSMKIWNLLAYLIVHRQRNVPQFELIETFWSDDEGGNPVSALKTLFFRMRRMIASVMGEDVNLIMSQRGSYSWNRNVECTVDIDEFERLCQKADDTGLSIDARIKFYGHAAGLYRGDFLPKMSGHFWTIPLSVRYHSMYLDMIRRYATLLEEKGKYAEMTAMCFAAISVDPLDEELHVMVLRALMAQNKHTEALAHYEKATDLMYRSLGVHPSDELRAIYAEIMKVKKSVETDLGVIQENLREYVRQQGAFMCDYGFFQEAFRLAARQAGRDGASMHIALITIVMPNGAIPKLDVLNSAVDRLQGVVMACLRRGDVVSRYSGAQFIILLPNANYEDSLMVVDRIKSSFVRKYRTSPVRLNCVVQQMEMMDGAPKEAALARLAPYEVK